MGFSFQSPRVKVLVKLMARPPSCCCRSGRPGRGVHLRAIGGVAGEGLADGAGQGPPRHRGAGDRVEIAAVGLHPPVRVRQRMAGVEAREQCGIGVLGAQARRLGVAQDAQATDTALGIHAEHDARSRRSSPSC